MLLSRSIRSFATVLSATLALSCADSSPTGTSPLDDGLLADVAGAVEAPIIQVIGFVPDATGRTARPVPWSPTRPKVSYSVSGTISPKGGLLSIPEADFTIRFPAGAVSQPINVTITADPNFVAYKMEPHGIVFARPVIIVQRLRNTAVFGSPLMSQLFGAYLADDLADLTKVLSANEIESSITFFVPGQPSLPHSSGWTIRHFSRYMLASG